MQVPFLNIQSFVFFFCVQVVAFNGTPVKNLKHLVTMVEECDEAFLKFDLDYDQVSGAQTKASYVCLLIHCQIWCSYYLLVLLITIWQFFFDKHYHLTVGCPGDENCKGCNSRYSDNTLYSFGCLRRPEELRKARCWLSAGTARRSYNPSGTRTLDFIDEYISRSTRNAERVPLQVRFCM